MREISVDTKSKYKVFIGEDILDDIGTEAQKYSLGKNAAIITDTNVEPLYALQVKKSLEKCGYRTFQYVIESGEKSKNADTYIKLLNFLAENYFTRKDTVYALGGGVVGDLAGFCAATYMRGINFVQIPTSLLACVDSSVGGKTGIDLDMGKNLAGAFYQPKFVWCDIKCLSTLTRHFFEDGSAEVIKYAVIKDASLAELIKDFKNNTEEIISRCVEIKSDVVTEDEFESGLRKILNFGHTFGHSIEKASLFRISHGHAVAMGMYIITRACEKMNICEKETCEKLTEMLDACTLSYKTDFDAETIFESIKSDKKASQDGVDIVLPLKMGECIVKHLSYEEIYEMIKKGL